MQAGKLRYRATYQTPVRTDDGYGDSLPVFRDVQSFPCSITPVKASEIIKYRAAQVNVTHNICCRYTPVIQTDGRFLFNNRYFNIVSVINVEELGIELNIVCNEVVKPSGAA